jgi:sulfopyruvate decarboxylase subunit alpha
MIMENSGLRQACEPLARFALGRSVPMVMVVSFRGDLGERNWWGHNHAQTMIPILEALRITYRIISKIDELKPAIAKAFLHADSSQMPVALVLTGECVEPS